MKKISLFILIIVLLVSGCASTAYPTTKTEVYTLRKSAEIVTDEFNPYVTIKGLEPGGIFLYDDSSREDAFYMQFLRSVMGKGPKELMWLSLNHRIYVSYVCTDTDWRVFDVAYGLGGIIFVVDLIQTDLDCSGSHSTGECTFLIDFGISIPDVYMREHIEGFQLKVYEQKTGHSFMITISGHQIAEQLAAVDRAIELFHGDLVTN